MPDEKNEEKNVNNEQVNNDELEKDTNANVDDKKGETKKDNSEQNSEKKTSGDVEGKQEKEIHLNVNIPEKDAFSKDEVLKLFKDKEKELLKQSSQIYKGQYMDEITKLQNKISELESREPEIKDDEEKTKLSGEVEFLKTELEKAKDMTVNLYKDSIESYKEKLIASDPNIVVKMVKGDSKEELDASFAEAKEAYNDIQEKYKAQGITLPTDKSNESNSDNEVKPIEVKRLDSKEAISQWEHEREKVLRQAYREYGLEI